MQEHGRRAARRVEGNKFIIVNGKVWTYSGRIRVGDDGNYAPDVLKKKFPDANTFELKAIVDYFNTRGGARRDGDCC